MILGQLNTIDVKLLRVFRHIVECGGMSAAELELNISRSVISRQLKDLEIRLGGLRLCSRGRAGFSLTVEGRKVYNAILQLNLAIDSFRSEISDIHRTMTGNLVVAIGDLTMTNPNAHIAEAIHRFHQKAPEVTLEMYAQSLNAIEPNVIDGTYQIGIVPLHRNSSSLDYYPLFTEQMLLYCGRKHPLHDTDHSKIDWDEIRQYAFAGLGYHSPNLELTREIGLKRMAISYNQESIATLIASGSFIGFLPEHYASLFVNSGLIQRIDNDTFQYDVNYSVIVKNSAETAKMVEVFLKCLLSAHSINQKLLN